MKSYTLNRIKSNRIIKDRLVQRKSERLLFGLPISTILDNLSKTKL